MSFPTTGVLLEANVGDSSPARGLTDMGGLPSFSRRSLLPKKLFGFRSDWTAKDVQGEGWRKIILLVIFYLFVYQCL